VDRHGDDERCQVEAERQRDPGQHRVVVGAQLEDRGDAGERQCAHEGEHEQGS
jgi:hypothetical protein